MLALGAAAVVIGVVVAGMLVWTPSDDRAASLAPAGRSGAENESAARRDAERLLGEVRLPAGATVSTTEPRGDGGLLAHPAGSPAGAKLVDDHAFWTIAEPFDQVHEFVSSHRPAGSQADWTGASGGPGVPANSSISFTFGSPVIGIATRSLLVTLVALGPQQTGVRADAQDVWLVPRPRSERVPPGVRLLQITRSTTQSAGGVESGIAFTYTISDRVEIAQITRWLDALPAVQPGVTLCPVQTVPSVRVRFVFLSASGERLAVAAEDGRVPARTTACDAMSFAVRGRAEPALLDGGRFLTRVARLVHTRLG